MSMGGGGKGGGAGGPGAPTPDSPEFHPIDINNSETGLERGAVFADHNAYNMADRDFAARHPGIVATRASEMSDVLRQLKGPLDPVVQNSYAKGALAQALQSTGGGNAMASTGGTGSAERGGIAASIANSALQKQDADRGALGRLSEENQPRTFGLSPQNAVNLLVANNAGQNAANWNAYLNALGIHQGQVQQNAANQAALIQTGTAAVGAIRGGGGKGGSGGGGSIGGGGGKGGGGGIAPTGAGAG